MSAGRRILIVGGGIGGLSTGIALRRTGCAVDLIERNPAWDVYGVGIIQPGNALRALDALGLAEAVVAVGHPIIGDATWTGDGTVMLGESDWPPLVAGLPPANGITRPRLHAILQQATLDAGVDVRTGVTFERIDDGGGAVKVRSTDGEERVYDLVVGADGLHSSVRAHLFGPEVRARFTGQVCWRYNLPRIEGLDKIWMFLGEAGSAGLVPLSADQMYLLTIETPAPGNIRLPVAGLAATFRERIAGFGGPIADQRELIVNDDAVVYRPIENVLVDAPWYVGRVVLIGDAAHGTSPHCGQGAAQAIEDGLVLAAELAAADAVGPALATFMDRRFERCRRIVNGSETVGRWEMDHSLPINPVQVRGEVVASAMAPI